MTIITREREGPLIRDRNLQIVLALTTTSMLGVGSLSPAFPQIMQEFGLTSHQVALLITVYTAPGIVLSPLAGLAADRLGRKRVIVGGLLLFAFSALASAMARDFETLIWLRFIQGLGGSPLTALNNTVIGDIFSGRKRLDALGYNASIGSISALCHPLLGGAAALAGWRYPLLLPLTALPVAWLVAFRLNDVESEGHATLGSYLSGAAKGIFNRDMLALYLANLANIGVVYGVLMVYLVVLMKERYGAGPLDIGIVISTSAAVSAVISTQIGRIAELMSPRGMIVSGMVVSGIGIALNAVMPGLWWLLVPAAVRGIGQGVLSPALYSTIVDRAPAESRAAVMGFSSTMFRSGQTFGPPAFGLAYAAGGMDWVFAGGLIVSLAVALVAAAMLGARR
jgi:ACDE family multidrug resistance protein